MSDKPELTLESEDSRGYTPEAHLIGSKWKHLGNGHTYTIVGYVWNGEDDTWMMVHTRNEITSFQFVRTPINFNGYMSDGRPRYVRIAQ
jgi:hypothetical protein